MLMTKLKSEEVIGSLTSGKVFIINCHGCKEVGFPEAEAKALQKKLQDEQQEERIAKFDADLEAETAKRIEEITTKLHSTTDADQKKQRDSAAELLSSLDAYYEQNHGALSTQIYENIIRK